MRRLHWLLVLLAVLAHWPPARAEGRFYAVVVGVMKYEGELAPGKGQKFEPNQGAEAMAKGLRALAKRAGYTSDNVHVSVLTDRIEPTAKNIWDKLRQNALDATRPDDTLVFYFHGHGALFGKSEYALLAQGATGYDDDFLRLEFTKHVVDAVMLSPARRKLIIVDACRTTAYEQEVQMNAPSTEAITKHQLEELRRRPGLAILFGTQPGRPSFIHPDLGYGYFTKHMSAALMRYDGSAKAPRYVDELMEEVAAQVAIDVRETEMRVKGKRREQLPDPDLKHVARMQLLPDALPHRAAPETPVSEAERRRDSFAHNLQASPSVALEDADALVKLEGTADAWNKKGRAHFVLRDSKSALLAFDKAIALSSQDDDFRRRALYNRGASLIGLGRYKEAQQAMAEVLAQQPQHENARVSMALVQLQLGAYRESIQAFEELETQVVTAPARAFVRIGLGVALIGAGDMVRAEGAITGALCSQERLRPLVIRGESDYLDGYDYKPFEAVFKKLVGEERYQPLRNLLRTGRAC